MMRRNATQEEFATFTPRLMRAHTRLVSIHQRYVQLADLSDAGQQSAELYLQAINNQQLTCLRTIAVATTNRSSRRRTWEVSNHEDPTRNRTTPTHPNIPEEEPNVLLSSTVPIRMNTQEAQQQNPTSMVIPPVEQQNETRSNHANLFNGEANGHDNSISNKLETDVVDIKKRKIDFEFRLKQKQLQKEREMKDLELRYAREQEDMLLEIQRESQLVDSLVFDQDPPLASTPARNVNITPPPTHKPAAYTGQSQPPSSSNWPKLVVAKFDGDPRGWTKFAYGINVTLRDTSMPESLKLLALQDSLKDEIQKRVANIFTSTHSFLSAWAVLENKYGTPGLIIQAHNQHLQQLPPFKHNDFNGLFNMAVAVRDAVSSVNKEHIVMFTSVVSSLCAKLHIHLQSDWGKLAYGLNRLPTLQDFDQWIDTVVGAEELRGIKLTSASSSSTFRPSTTQYNANRQSSSGNQSAGSSNYGARNPTVLTQSLLTSTEVECPACKGSAKHRLESCNVFTRMLVNARAALCATNNHCFKCLIRGHYSSKCRRPNANCTECNGPHHALLHVPAIDSDQVELLIGMDLSTSYRTTQIVEPIKGEDEPAAHHTRFGWAVAGSIPQSLVIGPSNKKSVNLQSPYLPPSLSSVIGQFRSLKTFGTVSKTKSSKSQDEEDLQMVTILHRSITFVGCGFQIALPLRRNISVIPNNRNQDLSRFYSIEHRLMQPDMREVAIKYRNAIEKLIASGTAIHVNSSDINEPSGKVWYLPHFYVVNHNKLGKIRVAFDAAARFQGLCYNDLILRGPPSIPSLVGVLLHLRQYRFALSADIEAFYHRVGVAKKDQSLQRFVFRPFGSKDPVKTFQFTTLIFGAVCSSSAAVQTLQYAAKNNVNFPQVAAKMQDNFYSDDLIDSFESESEAADFAKAVTKILEAGGFRLTAFASSSHRVLQTIPPQQRSSPVLDINLNALPVEYGVPAWHEMGFDN